VASGRPARSWACTAIPAALNRSAAYPYRPLWSPKPCNSTTMRPCRHFGQPTLLKERHAWLCGEMSGLMHKVLASPGVGVPIIAELIGAANTCRSALDSIRPCPRRDGPHCKPPDTVNRRFNRRARRCPPCLQGARRP
jgi:hypothetical protein